MASIGTPYLRDFNDDDEFECAGIYAIDLTQAYAMIYNSEDESVFMFTNLTLLNGNTAPPYFNPSLKTVRMQAMATLRYSFPPLFDVDEGN